MNQLFKKLTPIEVAERELAQAELALLEAQSGKDFAECMVAYNKTRVDRLRSYISTVEVNRNENQSVA